MTIEVSKLATTAKRPETEIAWPACPSVSPRSCAIGVNRLTGMNSEAIRTTTQSVMVQTAPHAGRAEPRLASDALMSVMESVMAVMVRAQPRLEGWTSVWKGE